MSRSAEDAHQELMALLPPGWIMPRPGDGSLLGAILAAPARMFAEIEAVAEEMIDQIDPRTATHTLDDFERVLGQDPCGRDTAGMSIADRQQLAHQRWTARGGQSIAYFVALAARRGVAITIEESIVSQADYACAGDELVNEPEQFTWLVRLAFGGWIVAEADDAVAGDLLVEYDLNDIECDIRRLAPAQTEVVFSYFEPIPENALLWRGEPITLAGEYLVLDAAEG